MVSQKPNIAKALKKIVTGERYCYASPKPEFFLNFFVYIFIHISANTSPFGFKFSQMILHTETSKPMYNWSFLFLVLHKPTLLPSTFKTSGYIHVCTYTCTQPQGLFFPVTYPVPPYVFPPPGCVYITHSHTAKSPVKMYKGSSPSPACKSACRSYIPLIYILHALNVHFSQLSSNWTLVWLYRPNETCSRYRVCRNVWYT